jgi:hypothetical protein
LLIVKDLSSPFIHAVLNFPCALIVDENII